MQVQQGQLLPFDPLGGTLGVCHNWNLVQYTQ